MKFFTKHILVMVLAFSILLGLTACGGSGKGDTPTSGTEQRGNVTQPEQSSTPGSAQAPASTQELTLADGEAKLIYAKDNYVVAAFHGPYKDIGAYFCDKDGERLEDFVGYGHPSDGWTLIIATEFPEDYDLNSGFGVTVSDYNAEQNPDGTYQKQNYFITEQMTKEEMINIGLSMIADHVCTVSTDKPTYGSDNFTAPFVYVNYLDEYHDRNIEEIDGLMESFSFYAEDGTPLRECFEGYTMECEPGFRTSICIYFRMNDTGGSSSERKEQNKVKCDELRALKPYIVYTAPDGTTQQFPFFVEQ